MLLLHHLHSSRPLHRISPPTPPSSLQTKPSTKLHTNHQSARDPNINSENMPFPWRTRSTQTQKSAQEPDQPQRALTLSYPVPYTPLPPRSHPLPSDEQRMAEYLRELKVQRELSLNKADDKEAPETQRHDSQQRASDTCAQHAQRTDSKPSLPARSERRPEYHVATLSWQGRSHHVEAETEVEELKRCRCCGLQHSSVYKKLNGGNPCGKERCLVCERQ